MRDYEEKREEYLSIGVVEYWVFDRFERQMSVYRKGKRTRVVKEHQSYESQLLPGFVLEIDALLSRVEKWTKKKRK
jgi:Uma2 family endonuclease